MPVPDNKRLSLPAESDLKIWNNRNKQDVSGLEGSIPSYALLWTLSADDARPLLCS